MIGNFIMIFKLNQPSQLKRRLQIGLSSSSPTNLKIMSNHAKWSKKGNFEKKQFTLQNRHYWREKH